MLATIRQRTRIAAVATSVLLAITTAADADDHAAPALPRDAFAYGHVQIAELRETPNLEIITRLVRHVRAEASILSSNTLGLDLTTLTDVTVAVPSFLQLAAGQASGQPPFCVVANFDQSFRSTDVASQLPPMWQEVERNGHTLYVRNDNSNAIHIASNTQILIGSADGILWWLDTESASEDRSLSNLLGASDDAGQVHVGFDLRQIPRELFGQLPPGTEWASKADFASADLHLDEVVSLGAWFDYSNDQDANEAAQAITQLVKQGLDFLRMTEKDASSKLHDPDTSNDDKFGNLVGLALIRQAEEQLENVHVSSEEASAIVKLQIDSDLLMTTLFGGVGIAGIGSQANANFQTIAEQLNQ